MASALEPFEGRVPPQVQQGDIDARSLTDIETVSPRQSSDDDESYPENLTRRELDSGPNDVTGSAMYRQYQEKVQQKRDSEAALQRRELETGPDDVTASTLYQQYQERVDGKDVDLQKREGRNSLVEEPKTPDDVCRVSRMRCNSFPLVLTQRRRKPLPLSRAMLIQDKCPQHKAPAKRSELAERALLYPTFVVCGTPPDDVNVYFSDDLTR